MCGSWWEWTCRLGCWRPREPACSHSPATSCSLAHTLSLYASCKVLATHTPSVQVNLPITQYSGSIAEPDQRLVGFDLLSCVEV